MAKGDRARKRLEELGPLSRANADLIDSWVRWMRTKKLSRNTISAYALDLEQLARSYEHGARTLGELPAGETSLMEVTGPGLLNWLDDMADGDADEPEWAATTINRKLAAIRQFYKWLIVLKGHDIPNPATHLENARTGRSLPKFLEAADLREMFELLERRIDGVAEALPPECENPEQERLLATIDYLVMGMCYYWGLRISEATGILWSDFRLESTGDFSVVARRKGAEIRVFPSQPQLVPHMHRYLAARPNIQVKGAKHRDYLFLYPVTGRALTRQTAFGRIRRVAVTALGEKGEKVSPHWLRHSLARHLLDEGHDIEQVREALQHKRLDTTSIYLHAREGEIQRILQSRDLTDAERARARQLDGGPPAA